MGAGRWEGLVPGHEVLEMLREVKGMRTVLKTRFKGELCATRIVMVSLPRQYSHIVKEIALHGKGSPAGLPEDALLVLEGYRSAALASTLPGLPDVLDAGVLRGRDQIQHQPGRYYTEGNLYITTRWVQGIPLQDCWTVLGLPRQEWALQKILEVLDGLHRFNVAYGDLKPSNIVLGPKGVSIIDMDTMRVVAGPTAAAITRDLTPRFAAPEQKLDRVTYLSSDLYAFGAMVCRLMGDVAPGEDGFPPVLRAPWDRLVFMCLRESPLQRPTAGELLLAVRGEVDEPATWAQCFPEGWSSTIGWHGRDSDSEPVPDPQGESHGQLDQTPRSPGVVTERVPEPVAEVVTERVPEPVVAEWESQDDPSCSGQKVVVSRKSSPSLLLKRLWPPPSGARRLLLPVLMVFFVAMAVSGSFYLFHQDPAAREADGLAAEAAADLKQHKTVPALNKGESGVKYLDQIVQQAQAAVQVKETAYAMGVYALARMWQTRWHFKNARLDDGLFKEMDDLTSRTLDLGRTAEGILARALLDLAGCRLLPADDTRREELCQEGGEQVKAVARKVERSQDLYWMVVEAHWVAVMIDSTQAVRYSKQLQTSRVERLRQDAHQHCQAAWPFLEYAPVNGPELAEDCFPVAASVEAFDDYLSWSNWWLEWNLNEYGKIPPYNVGRIFKALHPDCESARTDSRGVLTPGKPDAKDPLTMCSYLGRVAVGCRKRAYTVLPTSLRMGRVFGGFAWSSSLPWGKVFSAVRNAPRLQCEVEGLDGG